MLTPVTQAGDTPAKPGNFITIDQRVLARVVGTVALMLPTVMIIAAFNPWLDTCYRASISHYYYAPFMGSFFIGALVFIGAYLLVYRGNKRPKLERYLSSAAGLFAIGVALFPTSGYGCDDTEFLGRAFTGFSVPNGAIVPAPILNAPLASYFQMIEFDVFGKTIGSDAIHYTCAAFLFAFLAWFSLRVFPVVDPEQRNADGTLTQQKITRNALYFFSGGVIIVSMMAMAASAIWDIPNWDAYKGTFWFETFALWAFGLSWMVKARFWGSWLNDQPT